METTLEKIAQIQPGYPFRARVRTEVGGDVAVIQMKDVPASGSFECAGLSRVLLDGAPGNYQIADGDLVMKGRGTTHSVAQAQHVERPTIAAAPLVSIRVNRSAAHPQYVQWWLNHPQTQAALSAQAVGTYVQNLPISVLKRMEIPLPPLSTQERIVEIAQLGAREHELTDLIGTLKQRVVDSSLYGLATNSRRSPG